MHCYKWCGIIIQTLEYWAEENIHDVKHSKAFKRLEVTEPSTENKGEDMEHINSYNMGK